MNNFLSVIGIVIAALIVVLGANFLFEQTPIFLNSYVQPKEIESFKNDHCIYPLITKKVISGEALRQKDLRTFKINCYEEKRSLEEKKLLENAKRKQFKTIKES